MGEKVQQVPATGAHRASSQTTSCHTRMTMPQFCSPPGSADCCSPHSAARRGTAPTTKRKRLFRHRWLLDHDTVRLADTYEQYANALIERLTPP
jgi:hypothetical protein